MRRVQSTISFPFFQFLCFFLGFPLPGLTLNCRQLDPWTTLEVPETSKIVTDVVPFDSFMILSFSVAAGLEFPILRVLIVPSLSQ